MALFRKAVGVGFLTACGTYILIILIYRLSGLPVDFSIILPASLSVGVTIGILHYRRGGESQKSFNEMSVSRQAAEVGVLTASGTYIAILLIYRLSGFPVDFSIILPASLSVGVTSGILHYRQGDTSRERTDGDGSPPKRMPLR
jgi:hypothetical protein